MQGIPGDSVSASGYRSREAVDPLVLVPRGLDCDCDLILVALWGLMEMTKDRFFNLAGPMSVEDFISGDYPMERVARRLLEFEGLLSKAESLEVVRKEFYRIFTEDK